MSASKASCCHENCRKKKSVHSRKCSAASFFFFSRFTTWQQQKRCWRFLPPDSHASWEKILAFSFLLFGFSAALVKPATISLGLAAVFFLGGGGLEGITLVENPFSGQSFVVR